MHFGHDLERSFPLGVSKMFAVTINSSAPVWRMNSSRPRWTVSGPPTMAGQGVIQNGACVAIETGVEIRDRRGQIGRDVRSCCSGTIVQ
jgi:hypothetical protein